MGLIGALRIGYYLGHFMKKFSQSPINVPYKLPKFKSPKSYTTAKLGANSKRYFLR